ncbi:MAG TPA: hypothetical protein VN903_13295 [Polyangia bacterium]|nr:hypothetical protein [Polyangia bacterium]
MAVYAVIDANGVVINVIVWDGVAEVANPDDLLTVLIDGLDPIPGIDWTYDGATFTPPPPTPPET